jgi:mRNA interferase HigB
MRVKCGLGIIAKYNLQFANYFLPLCHKITAMNIRRKDLIDNFIKNHADAKSALQRWIIIVEKAEWKMHTDIKADFPAADYVGKERYVFNIRGNNYRMVAVVIFIANSLTIRFLGTHDEYDKIDCKTV